MRVGNERLKIEQQPTNLAHRPKYGFRTQHLEIPEGGQGGYAPPARFHRGKQNHGVSGCGKRNPQTEGYAQRFASTLFLPGARHHQNPTSERLQRSMPDSMLRAQTCCRYRPAGLLAARLQAPPILETHPSHTYQEQAAPVLFCTQRHWIPHTDPDFSPPQGSTNENRRNTRYAPCCPHTMPNLKQQHENESKNYYGGS